MNAVSVVVFAPAPHAGLAALLAALEAGVGPVRHCDQAGVAQALLLEAPRAVLLLDLRAGGAPGRDAAEGLLRACPRVPCLGLLPPRLAAPAGAGAVLRPPVYLAEVVRWCTRAGPTPPAEEVVADLVAGMKHEIGNPLTALLLQIELLKADPEQETVSAELELIEESARRIESVLEDVARAAGQQPVQTIESTLTAFLDRARERLADRDPELVARLDLRGDDRALVADPELLTSSLADVWEYLLVADGDGAPLLVEAGRSGGRVHLVHTTRADRLPADAAARLFTPLWARQALGLPAGLSLTSARAAFRRHGGDVRARRGADGQLVVDAWLPAEGASASNGAAS